MNDTLGLCIGDDDNYEWTNKQFWLPVAVAGLIALITGWTRR